MYQKKEKNFLQKMSPHLSQLNIAMAHRNDFSQNNMQILKLATYPYKDWRLLFWGANLATFEIGKDGQIFMLFCLYKTWSFTDL